MDLRLLVLAGMLTVGATMYTMSGWSLNVGAEQFIWTSVIQGVGMGFAFAPLTMLAFSTLPVHLRTEASGFFALVRNVGGAVGISIVISRLSSLTQTNHAHLSEFMTPFRHLMTMAGMSARTSMEVMNGEITRQAGMVAYVNVFRLLAILSVAFTPLLFLIRLNPILAKPDPAAAAAH
jgi:DHA2 family multidrug resistance protein